MAIIAIFCDGIWNSPKSSIQIYAERPSRACDVTGEQERISCEHSLWKNLSDGKGGRGLNQGDTSENRRYQQVWLAGEHGKIGGSTEDQSLEAV